MNHPNTPQLKALIFDVDGTLADTEQVHLRAFNHAFAQLGTGWEWDLSMYNHLLSISGGKERIKYYVQTVRAKEGASIFSDQALNELVNQIHRIKTQHYTDIANNVGIALRPGVLRLIQEAQQRGLKLAIATTTTPENIDALLKPHLGAQWKNIFSFIGDAQTAPLKKPHPMVYLQVLQALNLQANECVALEDSDNGLAASMALSIPTLITPTAFTSKHNFYGAMRVIQDLDHSNALLNASTDTSVHTDAHNEPNGVGCALIEQWYARFIQAPPYPKHELNQKIKSNSGRTESMQHG